MFGKSSKNDVELSKMGSSKRSAASENKIQEALAALDKISIKKLDKILLQLDMEPEKADKDLHELIRIGDLLSADWQQLTLQDKHKNPDAVLAVLAAKIPANVSQQKFMVTKLDKLTQIFDKLSSLQAGREGWEKKRESMKAELETVEAELKSNKEKCNELGLKKNTEDKELLSLLRVRELYIEKVETLIEMIALYEKMINQFNVYNRAIADIYTSIRLILPDPSEMKASDWLQVATERLICELSMDPASKASIASTYNLFQGIVSEDSKFNASLKFDLLMKALIADYLQLQPDQQVGVSASPSKIALPKIFDKTFEEVLNASSDKNHAARKLGLVLKVVVEHYPEVKDEVKNKIPGVSKLKNPYKDFLAHVSKPKKHPV